MYNRICKSDLQFKNFPVFKMATVYRYRIYCNTEAQWKYVWGPTPPVACPTDTAHPVNPDSISIIDEVSTTELKIKEVTAPSGQPPVGGYYRLKSQAFDALANSTTTSSFVYPYPVGILSGTLKTDLTHTGDIISIGAAYDTTVGTIAADVITNDVVIPVPPSVLAVPYIRTGGHIRLTDGKTSTPYIPIATINMNTNVICLASGIPSGYLAASPTYIQVAVIFCDAVEIGVPGDYTMGKSNIGGTYVPPGVAFRITYVNNGNTDKRISLRYDFYY